VLASIGSRVQLYKWAAREGAAELVVECGYGGFTSALFVEHLGESILVGAAARRILIQGAEDRPVACKPRIWSAQPEPTGLMRPGLSVVEERQRPLRRCRRPRMHILVLPQAAEQVAGITILVGLLP